MISPRPEMFPFHCTRCTVMCVGLLFLHTTHPKSTRLDILCFLSEISQFLCLCAVTPCIKPPPPPLDSSPCTARLCFVCSNPSRVSPPLPPLPTHAAIPVGRAALLITQPVVLLASLSGELSCRLGRQNWSRAKRSIHCAAAQPSGRDGRGGDGPERSGLEGMKTECSWKMVGVVEGRGGAVGAAVVLDVVDLFLYGRSAVEGLALPSASA